MTDKEIIEDYKSKLSDLSNEISDLKSKVKLLEAELKAKTIEWKDSKELAEMVGYRNSNLEAELSKREDTSILLEAAREEIKRLGTEYLSIKNDDFKVQQCEDIPNLELAEKAQSALSKLRSTGGRSFTMTVPPRLDDTDMILSEVIKRFELLHLDAIYASTNK